MGKGGIILSQLTSKGFSLSKFCITNSHANFHGFCYEYMKSSFELKFIIWRIKLWFNDHKRRVLDASEVKFDLGGQK